MTGGPRRGRRPSSRPPAYRSAVAATEPAAAPRVATASAAAAASVLEVAADRRRGTAAAACLEAAQEERPLRPSQGRLLLREALIRAPTAKHVREMKTASRVWHATLSAAQKLLQEQIRWDGRGICSGFCYSPEPPGQGKRTLRGHRSCALRSVPKTQVYSNLMGDKKHRLCLTCSRSSEPRVLLCCQRRHRQHVWNTVMSWRPSYAAPPPLMTKHMSMQSGNCRGWTHVTGCNQKETTGRFRPGK